MKNGKTTGFDKITMELLKYMGLIPTKIYY